MNCFGFYNDKEVTCRSMCNLRQRCRAVAQTHGDTLVAKYLEELILRTAAYEDQEYSDSDRIGMLTDQLLMGPLIEDARTTALRDKGQLKVKAEDVDLGDID